MRVGWEWWVFVGAWAIDVGSGREVELKSSEQQ